MLPEVRARRKAAIVAWTVVITLAATLAVGTLLFYGNSHLKKPSNLSDPSWDRAAVICSSDECNAQAIKIDSSIDDSYSPCDRFYSFTCGKYSVDIDPEQRSHSREKQLQSEINQKLHDLLNSSVAVEPQVAQMAFVKQLYLRCVSPERVNSIPLFKRITEKITSLEQPVDKIAKTISFGESAVVDIRVKPDPFNSSQDIIWLDQPRFSISRLELLSRKATGVSSSHVQSFIDFVELAFDHVFHDAGNKQEAIKAAVDFEIELAKKSTKPYLHEDHKTILRKMTLAQLDELVSSRHLPLSRLVDKIAQFSHHQLRVPSSTSVIVGDIDYLTNLAKVIDKYWPLDTSTPSVLDTYLTMRVILSYTFLLLPELNSLENVLTGNFSHVESFKLRDRCLDLLREQTPELLDRYYSHIHRASDDDILKINKMKTSIVKAYIEAIANDPELSWADSERLAFKALNVTFNLAYPQWIFNSSLLAQHSPNVSEYESLDSQNSPVLLAFDVKKKAFSKKLDLLLPSENDRVSHWPVSASSLSIAYDPLHNAVTIPASVIQPFYFHVNFTDALNYAGIGVLIANGLMHAFTRQGIQYDQQGNLKPWLSLDAIETFVVRQECVELIFSYKYSDMDIKLDGERIIDESTADLAAIKLAFTAYLSVKESPIKLNTSLLDSYSNAQLFYIHFASIHCHLESKTSLRYQVLNEPFAPKMVRVLYPLINSEEFPRAFRCSNSTRMVPEARCKVL